MNFAQEPIRSTFESFPYPLDEPLTLRDEKALEKVYELLDAASHSSKENSLAQRFFKTLAEFQQDEASVESPNRPTDFQNRRTRDEHKAQYSSFSCDECLTDCVIGQAAKQLPSGATQTKGQDDILSLVRTLKNMIWLLQKDRGSGAARIALQVIGTLEQGPKRKIVGLVQHGYVSFYERTARRAEQSHRLPSSNEQQHQR